VGAPPAQGGALNNTYGGSYQPPACDLKYDMAWGADFNDGFFRNQSNPMYQMKGIAPVTPETKQHFGGVGGLPSHGGRQGRGPVVGWPEYHKDYRDIKHHDLNSPMFLGGIIKESPHANSLFPHPGQGNYNITYNINNYTGR